MIFLVVLCSSRSCLVIWSLEGDIDPQCNTQTHETPIFFHWRTLQTHFHVKMYWSFRFIILIKLTSFKAFLHYPKIYFPSSANLVVVLCTKQRVYHDSEAVFDLFFSDGEVRTHSCSCSWKWEMCFEIRTDSRSHSWLSNMPISAESHIWC